MKKRQLDLAMLAICVAWAVVVLPRMFTGRWSPGAEAAITWAGGLLRIALLAVAAVAATRGARALDSTNQPEPPVPVADEMELLPVTIKDTVPDLSLPYHVRFPNELQLSSPSRFNSMATAELIRLCRECR